MAALNDDGCTCIMIMYLYQNNICIICTCIINDDQLLFIIMYHNLAGA